MGFSGKNLKIFGNHVVPRTGRRWITWCPGPWDTLLGLDIVHMGGFLNGCQKPIGFITQMVQWLGWFGGTTMTGWKPPYLLISKHIDDPGSDVPLVNGAPKEASCRFQRHLEWNLGVLMTPTSSVGHFLRSPISRNSKNGLLICCSMSILSTLTYNIYIYILYNINIYIYIYLYIYIHGRLRMSKNSGFHQLISATYRAGSLFITEDCSIRSLEGANKLIRNCSSSLIQCSLFFFQQDSLLFRTKKNGSKTMKPILGWLDAC